MGAAGQLENPTDDMRLRELLKVCTAPELAELHAFWGGDGGSARDQDLCAELAGQMNEEWRVRRRLRFLSRKLVELLGHFLARRGFEASLDDVRRMRVSSRTSPHEIEAGVRALTKRGFLFPVQRTAERPSSFVVPHELGELLRAELQDLDLALADAFSLRRMLHAHQGAEATRDGRGFADGDAGERSEASSNGSIEDELNSLARPESIDERRDQLSLDDRTVFGLALEQGQGLLSRSAYLRNGEDSGTSAQQSTVDENDTDDEHDHAGHQHNGRSVDASENGHARKFGRSEIKDALERNRLGTVRHLALGEYGINHFDDMVIVFEEVLRAELQRRHPEPAPGDEVRSLGVDLLSDLAEFLGRLSSEKVRLTQNGTVYRTVARKIESELILGATGELTAEELLEFLFSLALRRHLARRTPDRHLVLTAKGRTWPRLGVAFKLKELLRGVTEDLGEQFHRPRLRKLTLDVLRTLRLEHWYDFSLLVGLVRHRYLATLDEAGVRESYQSRYQYSSEAHMRDLTQLTHMIADFLEGDLHLLGLVDVVRRGERTVAARLSPLCSKVLGVDDAEGHDDAGPRILVNPDFEVLVLPEGDTYELIQRLDRFAERCSAELANRFRITAASVERAVAAGMTVAEILETLSAHSDSELPQNVVYFIRDHAGKVRFVRAQPALLLSARHKEVVDYMLRHSDVRRVLLERLGPRLLALRPDTELEKLLAVLEADGIFLEGRDVLGSGGEGSTDSGSNPSTAADSDAAGSGDNSSGKRSGGDGPAKPS